MAVNLSELLNRLESKTNILAERYSLVKTQRDEAIADCVNLRDENKKLQAQLQQANTQIEYLKISHKIAPTPQDTKEAQAALEALVKKIDKCIRQLRAD